jgi:hypothetical protein
MLRTGGCREEFALMKKVRMLYQYREDIWIGATPHDCPEWAIGATVEECFSDFMMLLTKYGLTIGEDDQHRLPES